MNPEELIKKLRGGVLEEMDCDLCDKEKKEENVRNG